MLLSHFKFSFKEDKLNFRFIGTLTIISTLSDHLSWWLKMTPRTLNDVTGFNSWPLICKGAASGLYRKKLIVISLHFFAFSFISLRSVHCWITSRSDCNVDWPCLGRDTEIVISSTYFQWLVLYDFNSRSFIITKNSIGPNLVPWGTPPFI